MIEYIFDGRIYTKRNLDFTLGNFDFFLLVLSTLLVAAAGYIINDYFDTKIDRINKPDRVVIDKGIKRDKAIYLHWILSALAVIIGFYLSWKIGHFKFGFIHLLSVGLLWFYSTTFKREFFLGNLIVAALTGMVPLLVGLFEPKIYEGSHSSFSFILGYSFFAFIISMAREIIKDMEDIKGDAALNCRTIPIVLGINGGKIIAAIFLIGIMAFVAYLQVTQYTSGDMMSFWYFLLALQVPLLFTIGLTFSAKTKKEFHLAGLFAKGVMAAGVFSMLIFYYSL
ncbi:MAG: geranylgeranylglycerol-phosphate geranylgeranyltransferase [Bacteroidia bacterium]